VNEDEMLLLRRALNNQRSEKKAQRKNIFNFRYTVQGKVYMFVDY